MQASASLQSYVFFRILELNYFKNRFEKGPSAVVPSADVQHGRGVARRPPAAAVAFSVRLLSPRGARVSSYVIDKANYNDDSACRDVMREKLQLDKWLWRSIV